MGDPRRLKKKYNTPSHPWQRTRIEEENALQKEYGLKNKQEIWKHKTQLQRITTQAKRLIALQGKQAELEQQQMFSRLARLGLLRQGRQIDDVLSLGVRDILERRLQTIVFRKNLAKSMIQARQFITHEHISINGIKLKAPGYIVTVEEENAIAFAGNSKMANPDHAERAAKASKENARAAELIPGSDAMKAAEEQKEKDKQSDKRQGGRPGQKRGQDKKRGRQQSGGDRSFAGKRKRQD